MTQYTFGGGSNDVTTSTQSIGGIAYERVMPSTTVTFWSAQTGGSQYTVTVGGVGVTSVTSDSNGYLPAVLGPSGVTSMWADAGAGRVLMYAYGLQQLVGNIAWAANTAYTTGQIVLAPDGTTLSRITGGTSRSTFDSTEQAAWNVVATQSGTLQQAALSASFVSKTPTAGSYTYSSGNVTQDPDGVTYTYNLDGTLHTETVPQPGGGTITRTYTYNTDGTIASVA